ncbi:hypothetical protein CspHIS471_0605220 [Cutaneotrichosporon sp. HIS471]|nr:hypothetical protein CspHIS471_0605220 [Cutaneotrichosporon sp. HIS471]
MEQNAAITLAPAPWRCRASVYTAVFWVSPSQTTSPGFKEATYAPLERSSPFADAMPEGGLASIMIIRYHQTPVGAYDEMMLLPGKFGFEVDVNGKRTKKSKLRITRIYVSQRNTTWNGRTNWNTPKHLARFDFTENPDGSADCQVYPLAEPSLTPIFQARFVPNHYLPTFPLSTRVSSMVMDMEIAQPPLPESASESTPEMLAAAREQGGDDTSELVGTDKWCSFTPYQYSPGCRAGWMDMQQADGGNFIPGASRWATAVHMPLTEIKIGEAVWWDAPKSML